MSDHPMSNRKREAFELPDTTDIDSVNKAQVTLIRLVAEARIGAHKGLEISRMLEHRRRAIATGTLWEKIQELDAQGRQTEGEEP